MTQERAESPLHKHHAADDQSAHYALAMPQQLINACSRKLCMTLAHCGFAILSKTLAEQLCVRKPRSHPSKSVLLRDGSSEMPEYNARDLLSYRLVIKGMGRRLSAVKKRIVLTLPAYLATVYVGDCLAELCRLKRRKPQLLINNALSMRALRVSCSISFRCDS